VTPALVLALDEQLGPPVDGYLNGAQVWLTERDDDTVLEWRLHPVAGFEPVAGLSPDDRWDEVVAALAGGAAPDALPLGGTTRALASIWEGLELFPPHGDEIEPALLGRIGADQLGIPPDAVGLVDHERIGSTWERSRGRASLVSMLLAELRG